MLAADQSLIARRHVQCVQEVIACKYSGILPAFRVKMQEDGGVGLAPFVTSGSDLVKLSVGCLNGE